jgi:hypothetical protein
MNKNLAVNLCKITPLPTRLQEILWELNEYEVTKNLAQNPSLVDEISIKILEMNTSELTQLLLTEQRSEKVLKTLKSEQINKHNINLVIEQKSLPKNLLKLCSHYEEEPILRKILEKNLESLEDS